MLHEHNSFLLLSDTVYSYKVAVQFEKGIILGVKINVWIMLYYRENKVTVKCMKSKYLVECFCCVSKFYYIGVVMMRLDIINSNSKYLRLNINLCPSF